MASVATSSWCVLESDRTPVSTERYAQINKTVTWAVLEVPVAPGDLIRIRTFAVVAMLYHTQLALDFYVVEREHAGKILQGETSGVPALLYWAADTYPVPPHGESIPAAGRPVEPEFLDIVRPDPPNPMDHHVALLFIMQHNATRAAEITSLANGSAQDQARLQAREDDLLFGMPKVQSGWFGDVRVLDPDLVAVQTPLLGIAAVAAVTSLGAAGWHWRTRRRFPAIPDDASFTEALLHLVQRGETYLAGLRNLLFAVGVVLLVVGAAALPILLDELSSALYHYSRGQLWETLLTSAILVTFGALCLTWAASFWSVHRELRRWRSRANQEPINF